MPRLFVLLVVLQLLFYIAIGCLIAAAVNHIRHNGGVKKQVEEIWSGTP